MALLEQLRRRKPADLLLAVEAVLLLSFFRVGLKLVPVRRIIRAVCRGSAKSTNSEAVLPATAREVALRVRWAVESAARNSPARFVCFPQSLAGYLMLRRRGVPSTIVYGVARSAEGAVLAHTWLMLGDRMVLGGEGSEAFSPIERWN